MDRVGECPAEGEEVAHARRPGNMMKLTSEIEADEEVTGEQWLEILPAADRDAAKLGPGESRKVHAETLASQMGRNEGFGPRLGSHDIPAVPGRTRHSGRPGCKRCASMLKSIAFRSG